MSSRFWMIIVGTLAFVCVLDMLIEAAFGRGMVVSALASLLGAAIAVFGYAIAFALEGQK